MKKMNMRKRFWNMELQLFSGEDDGDGGSGEGNDDLEDDPDNDDDPEDDPDEKKFTQKDLDDAVKKNIAKERRKWQREQQKKSAGKSKPEKTGDNDDDGEQRIRVAEEKASNYEMKWTCLEHDVKKECVDDVLALAKVRVSKDNSLDIEDAIDDILEKYPHFKNGTEDDKEDDEGEEEEEKQKKSWGKRHNKSAKQTKTVDDEIRKQLFGK